MKTPHRDTGSGRSPGRGPRPTGAQVVYAALRQAIIVLDIEPGASLEEVQLCRQYKVSRTPVREALIRLASEGLVELEPNRGAKVASLQLVDVVDHYEAMDILQPVVWYLAAVRRTDADLDTINKNLAGLEAALFGKDAALIVRTNYEVHRSIAAACHNRSLEKAYRQMLVDKLRVTQHIARETARDRGHILADRMTGSFKIIKRLMSALRAGKGIEAERLAREYNSYVRGRVMDVLSASLASEITPPQLGAGKRWPGIA